MKTKINLRLSPARPICFLTVHFSFVWELPFRVVEQTTDFHIMAKIPGFRFAVRPDVVANVEQER